MGLNYSYRKTTPIPPPRNFHICFSVHSIKRDVFSLRRRTKFTFVRSEPRGKPVEISRATRSRISRDHRIAPASLATGDQTNRLPIALQIIGPDWNSLPVLSAVFCNDIGWKFRLCQRSDDPESELTSRSFTLALEISLSRPSRCS